MNGINFDTPRGKFFELLINTINANIKILDEYGVKILDKSDFDYYISGIQYSPAYDKVLAEFKGVGD